MKTLISETYVADVSTGRLIVLLEMKEHTNTKRKLSDCFDKATRERQGVQSDYNWKKLYKMEKQWSLAIIGMAPISELYIYIYINIMFDLKNFLQVSAQYMVRFWNMKHKNKQILDVYSQVIILDVVSYFPLILSQILSPVT